MTTLHRSLRLFLSAALVSLIFIGCEEAEERGSLNDLSVPRTAQPAISGITPSGSALAGVDTLTITGSNFSSDASKNIVFFNSDFGTILSASPTQIVVLAPLVIGDSVKIRVAVQTADLFSATRTYQLRAAVREFGNLAPNEWAGGITTDATGNLFAAINQEGTLDLGVGMFTPAGVRTLHAPATPGASQWGALKMGPGGDIYAGRNVRAVYRYASGGGAAAALWKAFPFGTFITDFDFDPNDYLWSVGNNTQIHVVKQDGSLTSHAFAGNIRSARFFNGYLYFSATVPTLTDTVSKVWRATITGDVLGTPEVYFDFAGAYGAQRIANGITFASDGTMFVGTGAPEGVVVVYPSGAHGAPYFRYASLFGSGVRNFAWGSGDALYATTLDGGLIVIATTMASAPYYGIQ